MQEQDGLDQSKDQRGDETQSHHGPATLDDLLVGDSHTQIPDQVADAVEAVDSERERNEVLDQELSSHWQSSEGGSNRSGLEVPTQQRCDEVRSGESIETSRKESTGDTVGSGKVPSDLGAVDRKVRGDRAAETLLCQQLGRISGVRR